MHLVKGTNTRNVLVANIGGGGLDDDSFPSLDSVICFTSGEKLDTVHVLTNRMIQE